MKESTLDRVREHLNNSKKIINEKNIVGIFLYGSQNYGLRTPESDVDTRLLITPTISNIAFNKNPLSKIKILDKQEHTELKDIRLFFREIKKQNPNSLEILFTKYNLINNLYFDEWKYLIDNRELISRYNPTAAVKSMCGMAHEAHKKASKETNYKALQILLRMEDFIKRYIEGETYRKCLKPKNIEFLKSVKIGELSKEEYTFRLNNSIENIKILTEEFLHNRKEEINSKIEEILNQVQLEIIKKSIKMEM